MLFCGFNGFQQFNYLVNDLDDIQGKQFIPKFIECPGQSFIDADMSWSNALIINDNRATLSGFLNGKPGESFCLETPDKENIIQKNYIRAGYVFDNIHNQSKVIGIQMNSDLLGRCNKEHCFIVTSKGKCWQYNLETSFWKEINYVQCTDSIKNVFVKVALGEIINAVLNSKGEVWNFGNQLSHPKMKVIDIDCGKEHGILLTDSGCVYTWGSGRGYAGLIYNEMADALAKEAAVIGGRLDIKLVRTESRGQLGNGTLDNSEEICQVDLLAGLKITKISAGGWHNAVLSVDGDIYSWGWNKQGQLGHPTLDGNNQNGVAVLAEPRLVNFPNSLFEFVEDISCGTSHTVALLENEEVWGCGWNKWGQLGTIKFQTTHRMTKLELPASITVKKVICAAWNTLIIC